MTSPLCPTDIQSQLLDLSTYMPTTRVRAAILSQGTPHHPVVSTLAPFP